MPLQGEAVRSNQTRPAPAANQTHSAATTLAVAILFSHHKKEGLEWLIKSITLVSRNVAPYTPTRMYVYTLQRYATALRADLGPASAFGLADGQLRVESIPKDQWRIPALAESSGNESLWEVRHAHHGHDYRMMGEWYLQHMAPAVQAFGHRYVLKMDSDSFIHGPIGRCGQAVLTCVMAAFGGAGQGRVRAHSAQVVGLTHWERRHMPTPPC
jgi:hypothetical protein